MAENNNHNKSNRMPVNASVHEKIPGIDREVDDKGATLSCRLLLGGLENLKRELKEVVVQDSRIQTTTSRCVRKSQEEGIEITESGRVGVGVYWPIFLSIGC